MGNISLLHHEHEVERSRAKLTQDLAALCSPQTFAAFTDDLKQQAFATRTAEISVSAKSGHRTPGLKWTRPPTEAARTRSPGRHS
jgi:hypothetical protein